MIKLIIYSIITGTITGILFELFANEIPYATLLHTFVLHIWIIINGIFTKSYYQYVFRPKIPLIWIIIIVILSYLFLYFKSQAMESLPMPTFIVCYNMKLFVSLIVDYIIFSVSIISIKQVIGVILVTIGCVLITLQSHTFEKGKEYEMEYNLTLGLTYATLSVITVSLMIPISNLAVTKNIGGTFEEVLFMKHLLSLPLIYPNMKKLEKGWQALQLSSKVLTIEIPTSVVSTVSYLNKLVHHGLILIEVRHEEELFCDDTSVTSSIDVPVALLCLIGAMILTPIHRKQISEISISTNSSVVGQLIACAVKTIVLLFLFMILCWNTVSSSKSLFYKSEEDFQFDFDNIYATISSSLRFTMMSIYSCYMHCTVLFASMSAQIIWGVLMQVVGSILCISASSNNVFLSSLPSQCDDTRISDNKR